MSWFNAMLVKKEPFLLEVGQHEREEYHAFLQGTEAHICVPLVTSGRNSSWICDVESRSWRATL